MLRLVWKFALLTSGPSRKKDFLSARKYCNPPSHILLADSVAVPAPFVSGPMSLLPNVSGFPQIPRFTQEALNLCCHISLVLPPLSPELCLIAFLFFNV